MEFLDYFSDKTSRNKNFELKKEKPDYKSMV
jgi:hypothetical protein